MVDAAAIQPYADEEILDAVVVGAGFSGVAAAAGLAHYGARFRLLERSDTVASIWKYNYVSLRMHSPFSLPYFRPQRRYPLLMDKENVHAYVSEYFEAYNLAPRTCFGEEVVRVRFLSAEETPHWALVTANGERYRARHLVVATGQNRVPHWPAFAAATSCAPYSGALMHSDQYREPSPFAGQRVLVIGSGNSAAELALDLACSDLGVQVDLLVRSARYVVPRFVFQNVLAPLSLLGGLESAFQRELTLTAGQLYREALQTDTLLRHCVKDYTELGFEYPTHPLQVSLLYDHRIPLFDWGLMRAVRAGLVTVHRGTVTAFEGGTRVRLSDGALREYDSVICATGYRHGLDALLGERYLGQPQFRCAVFVVVCMCVCVCVCMCMCVCLCLSIHV
jgi:putative flavoprotein involved in K+ transport